LHSQTDCGKKKNYFKYLALKRFLQIQSQAYFQYLWYIVSGFLISPSAWAQTIPATLSWTGETRGIIFSSPVIDDNGIVYVGSNDNNLTAFNTDGSIKWTFTTGNWVDSSPALSKDGSIVYAGSWDNHLYAVNSDDGSLNWSFETNSYITSSPAVDLNGRVYFGSMDSIFYALESNGSLAWEYFVGQPVFSSPAIGENGTLYFGDENGTLHAVNPDGTVKWTYDIDDVVDTNKSILSSPAVDTSGNIYFGSGNGFCYSLSDDGDSVSLNWKYETGDRVDSSPVLGINDEVFFVSRDGYMRSLPIFSATNENLPNWEVFVGDVFYSTPVIDENGRVYVIGYTGDGENHLFAYDASGTKAWDSDVSPPPFEIPSVVDSSLLLSDDGNL
jgi:outer membrane protein assembly factor BamB